MIAVNCPAYSVVSLRRYPPSCSQQDPRPAYGGIGFITRDPVDAAVADGVQRSASAVANRVVDRGLAISPTIRVPAGARLTVIVTRRTVIWPH